MKSKWCNKRIKGIRTAVQEADGAGAGEECCLRWASGAAVNDGQYFCAVAFNGEDIYFFAVNVGLLVLNDDDKVISAEFYVISAEFNKNFRMMSEAAWPGRIALAKSKG